MKVSQADVKRFLAKGGRCWVVSAGDDDTVKQVFDDHVRLFVSSYTVVPLRLVASVFPEAEVISDGTYEISPKGFVKSFGNPPPLRKLWEALAGERRKLSPMLVNYRTPALASVDSGLVWVYQFENRFVGVAVEFVKLVGNADFHVVEGQRGQIVVALGESGETLGATAVFNL